MPPQEGRDPSREWACPVIMCTGKSHPDWSSTGKHSSIEQLRRRLFVCQLRSAETAWASPRNPQDCGPPVTGMASPRQLQAPASLCHGPMGEQGCLARAGLPQPQELPHRTQPAFLHLHCITSTKRGLGATAMHTRQAGRCHLPRRRPPWPPAVAGWGALLPDLPRLAGCCMHPHF